jgi:thiol-disulfide isomerase/thioredoxin
MAEPSARRYSLADLTRGRRLALASIVLVGAFFFGKWLGDRNAPYERAVEGDRAPTFTGVTLAGDTLSLESFRPEPVLLNIWATWCLPCVREMPGLDSLHAEYGPHGLHVIGVSVDDPGSEEEVAEFLRVRGIGYPSIFDPSQVVNELFFTFGVPETFLIDGKGRITRHWSGMILAGSAGVRSEIEKVLPSR